MRSATLFLLVACSGGSADDAGVGDLGPEPQRVYAGMYRVTAAQPDSYLIGKTVTVMAWPADAGVTVVELGVYVRGRRCLPVSIGDVQQHSAAVRRRWSALMLV